MITSPYYNFEFSRFNDGTPRVRIAEKSDKVISHGMATVYWYYDASCYAEDLFNLACVRDLFESIGVHKVVLIMPYVPNARMDRKQGTDAFTLKTFAKMINAMDFSKVIVYDPHSDVTPALLDRCEVHTNEKLLNSQIHKDCVVVFPDAGAAHRYGGQVKDKVCLVGNKVRDWETQYVTGYTLPNGEALNGKDAVLVDDIVAHGYTMLFLLKEVLKYEPANITLVTSHLEDSYYDGELFKQFPGLHIVTTNSIIRPRHRDEDGVHTFRVEDLL